MAGGGDTVFTDTAAAGFRQPRPMAPTLARPRDDDGDGDDGLEPQRPWEEMAAELAGEPLAPPGEDAAEDARLTEAELAAAAGVQPPPGRID